MKGSRKPYFNYHVKRGLTWPVAFRSYYGRAGTVFGLGALGILFTFTLHRL